MAEKIQRQTQKIFGGNAPIDDLAVFGSFKANNPIYTDNIEDLQSSAYEEGWNAAIIADEAPFLEEMNGVQYGLSKQLAYLFQEGVSEYDANTEYFAGSMAKGFNADNVPVIYRSLTDNNIGNPLSDTTHWAEWISGANIDLSNLSQAGIDKIKEYTAGSGFGFNLFDMVIKDHILTYEESKGFALQGTYVYKTPVAGSRYGYPDFYQKCLEEYKNSTGSLVSFKENVDKKGSLTTDNGVITGFSTTSYAVLPSIPNGDIENFEIRWKFTTGSDLTQTQVLLGQNTTNRTTPQLTVGGNGDGFFEFITSSTKDTFNAGVYNKNNPLKPNTTYIFDGSWDGTKLTGVLTSEGNSVNLVAETDAPISRPDTTTSVLWTENCKIGLDTAAYPFSGTIDLKECYININGTRWWSGADTYTLYKNPNGHLYYDIADKAVIDERFNTYGVAWFYGIDETNERVFLPRNNWFMQLTTDTSKVNDFNEAGLPNITGTTAGNEHSEQTQNTGCFYKFETSGSSPASGSGSNYGHGFDASLSNPIYGSSDTVQPTSSNKLLYICVGNTETISSITDVVDITTTENDTIPLGYSTYQGDGAQPSVAWLVSNGQWNSGMVYATFYNHYVPLIGQEFAAGYVRNHTETYEDFDLVINQDDMTFRLPLYDGSESIIDTTKWIDYPNPATDNSLHTAPANGIITFEADTGKADSPLGINVYDTAGNFVYGQRWQANTTNINQLITLPISKGYTFDINFTEVGQFLRYKFYYNKGNGPLYFKVANAVQNQELIDLGEVTNSLATKLSATNSPEIVNMLIPDWDNAITLDADAKSGYVIPHTGYYVITLSKNTSSSSAMMYVNGFRVQNQSITAAWETVDTTLFLGKGDTITTSGSVSECKVRTFIPPKGVQ